MFDVIDKESFDEREERILSFWKKRGIFEKSVSGRKNGKPFTFYDGPPFATGLPHYGHHLAGTIKDVVLRYKTLKGFYAPRRFGWDCHGLPVENEIEKEHNLSGADSIQKFGIANFNEECRKIVQRYSHEWELLVTRMGRWVDFKNTYKTMDITYMESVWWVFQQLFEKGLIYEGYKVMPFSAKLGTPLSNFEAGENYKDVDDPSLTVAFQLVGEEKTSLLAWTTTPWTLISNLALMVGPDIDYVKVKDGDQFYILAKESLKTYYKDASGIEIVDTLKGIKLVGKRYEPLFPYFSHHKEQGAFRVIPEEAVSLEEGTGIVHSAPGFGEVDFYACQREGIALVCPVDVNGCFTAEIPEYVGQFVKDADKAIIKRLKDAHKVVHHGTCHHRYPFCWRSDTPLIYKAVSSWFVAVEKIKEKLVQVNTEIHWTPDHIKFGRFGKWLEGARDWAISRNRYWGTPIPLWRGDDGSILVVGSIEELERLTGTKIKDLHRHFIDDLVITKDGKEYKRIPEVFDCWFESGSMPYAQSHYPFENQEAFYQTFPADFIAEGLDQTRGWFYTLNILSTALFGKPAFKNVIVNGIVLAKDGTKMSKRLKNYPDPSKVVHKYGADAVRLYMMHSPAVRADDLRFKEEGVELVLRQILIPWWNAYSFFITYARIYDWKPQQKFSQPEAMLDQWMISKLHKLIHEVEEGMDDYNLNSSVEPFVAFIDDLTNWYIRRSRRRFWTDKQSQDRDQAFATLYHVLIELTKITSPFVPFISEAMYLNLHSKEMPESVHLTDFPHYREDLRDIKLEEEMEVVKMAVSLGHALRKDNRLKVRQPLSVAHVASRNARVLEFLADQKHLIADELNVKKVELSCNEQEFVSLMAKPNFRVLGKKVGKLMRPVQEAINDFDQGQLKLLMDGSNVVLALQGEEVTITPEDVAVERSVHMGMIAANMGEITVALETDLDDDLIKEGLAREVVNKINTMRREAGLEVTDRIHITLKTTDKVRSCFDQFGDYITGEVLALSIHFEAGQEGTEWDLNGEPTTITLTKAENF